MAFFGFPPAPVQGLRDEVTPSPMVPQDGISQPFPGSGTLWEVPTNGLNFFPFEFAVLSR